METYFKFFIAFLAVTHFQTVSGQTKISPGRFEFGVFGGTQVWGKHFSDENLESVSGIVAGLEAGYSFSKNQSGFSLHLQPNWSEYGSVSEEGKNTQFYRKDSWNWKAINLPLIVRYTFTAGKIRPFVDAGANFRFRNRLSLTKSGYNCGFAGCSVLDGVITDLHTETSQDKFGIIAGAGLEIDVWKLSIPISIRINEQMGSYKTKNMQSDDGIYVDNFKTRTIQIVAGLTF